MKFLYTTIIHCDHIYPRHYPLYLLPTPTDLFLLLNCSLFYFMFLLFWWDKCVYLGLLSQEHGWGVIYRSIDNLVIATPMKKMSPPYLNLGQAAQVPPRLTGVWVQVDGPSILILWNRLFFSHEMASFKMTFACRVWAWQHKPGEAGNPTKHRTHTGDKLNYELHNLSLTEKVCSADYSDMGSRRGHWGWPFIFSTKLCNENSEQWRLSSVALGPGSAGHLAIYEGWDGSGKRSERREWPEITTPGDALTLLKNRYYWSWACRPEEAQDRETFKSLVLPHAGTDEGWKLNCHQKGWEVV